MSQIINTTQGYAILNEARNQLFDGKDIGLIDASKIVDFGDELAGYNDAESQSFQGNMGTALYKQYFQNIMESKSLYRKFLRSFGGGPNSGYFQKTRIKTSDAVGNADTYNPAPGSTTDPFAVVPIKTESEVWGNQTSSNFNHTIPDKWFKGAFLSDQNFKNFLRMVEQSIEVSIAEYMDAAARTLLNSKIAANLYSGNDQLAVNFLARFNEAYGTDLKADKALDSVEFLTFMMALMIQMNRVYVERNTYCNLQGWKNGNSMASTDIFILEDVMAAFNTKVRANTFHENLIRFDEDYTSLTHFQSGGGLNMFDQSSTIQVKINQPWFGVGEVEVKQKGIVYAIGNRDGFGIFDFERSTESQRSPIGRLWNYFTLVEFSTVIDSYEDFLVGYIADPEDDFVLQQKQAMLAKAKTATKKAAAKK